MALVSLRDITKSFGPKVVLDCVTLDIQRSEKVGLVGANGVGKTTVFMLILGHFRPDSGTLTKSRNLRIGYLPQEPALEASATVIDEVSSVFEEVHQLEARMHKLADEIAHRHDSGDLDSLMKQYDQAIARFETAGGYDVQPRVNEVLGGLGFSQADRDLPISALSGGQKCRVALAKILLQETDLLLLDEPTNHLDIDATGWLEKWLAGYTGSAVIVSHDRYLLDRVVSKIIEVEDRGVNVYGCNYTHYAEAKRARLLQAIREYEKQHTWLLHQQEYIARSKADKSRAKQARGRRWFVERMARQGKVLEKPQAFRRKMQLDFEQPDRGGDMVLRCESVSKRYGDRVLFDGFDLEVYRGQKIGIMGPNGSGKTTLLKMALGQAEPDAGEIRLYENLTIGYFDQEHAGLNQDGIILDELQALRPECSAQEVRSYLGGFLFSGDEAFKKIGSLSGGEQSRVLLAMLVWMSPQVLILDEPTNHLDIPSREVLEEALIQYEGTVILVSHDRYFLDRVVNRLVIIRGDGRCQVLSGNYSDYARRQEEAAAQQAALAETDQKASRPRGTPRRGRTSQRASEAQDTSPYARMSLHHLEQEIIAREERLAEIERDFVNETIYRDGDRVRDLRAEHARLKAELAEMNRYWEERAEG
jgi:ATP-binding cassette subfamily F protein 3